MTFACKQILCVVLLMVNQLIRALHCRRMQHPLSLHTVFRASSTEAVICNVRPVSDWVLEASQHREKLVKKLFPPGHSLKVQRHAVREHPIYNFLHRYYRYSTSDLLAYSPGLNVTLSCAAEDDIHVREWLHPRFLYRDTKHNTASYSLEILRKSLTADKRLGREDLKHSLNVLISSNSRPPFFGCFGYHEWAMLYSGGEPARQNNGPGAMKKHQNLQLRLSQKQIDDVVESGPIRCTHYDAWRFFQPRAQTFNVANPLTRQNQSQYEQPGCIHANMDLFKYAYHLYPIVSSSLLHRALDIAIAARKMDMRASPYDCSEFEECQDGPILVETKEGRAQYIREQESLFRAAAPVRQELMQLYSAVLNF